MKRIGVCLALGVAGASLARGYFVEQEKLSPTILLVRHATLWTQGPQGILQDADMLVRDGKIVEIGRNLKAPAAAYVLEAAGKHVTPGLIDCHNHSAIRGGVNEGSNNVTAEVRIADVIEPDDIAIYRQLAGGLTAAHLLHGSANSIGGQDAVIKLRWGVAAEALLVADAKPGIKFALGENPKRSNFRVPGMPERYPTSRMGVMESIREAFLAARDSMREWEAYRKLPPREQERREPPRRDLQLEALAEILRGERVIHSHAYRQDEILALMRVAEEFGVRIATFQHVLEGYKIADELRAHGAGASTFSDWWAYKLEAYDAIPYNGALMHERGVLVSFNSDSSELARRMNLEAAKAVKYGGLDEQSALAFVTIHAARQLGIDHRTGSLEPGKDGDFVVWSGHPLSAYSLVEQTWVEGVREFDRAQDLERRHRVAALRAELRQKILHPPGGKEGEHEGKEAPPGQAGEPSEAAVPPSTAQAPEPAETAPRRQIFETRPRPYADRLAALGPPVSIVHATVHTLAGPDIEDGTVSFREGRIVEVGAGLPPLPGAQVVDARGLHVYPGMINAMTSLGLIEIGSVAGSVDLSETGDLNPHVNTALAVNPDSELIPVTRANGITHVLTAPAGELVLGTSSLTRLEGWTWEDLAAARPIGLHIAWPSFRIQRRSFFGTPPSAEEQKRRREERLKKISRLFEDARAYRKALQAEAQGGPAVDQDPRLEAMLPVLDGTLPVIAHADEVRQIEHALEWAAKEGVRLIVAGNGDLWRAAERLREHAVPVIVVSVLENPVREDDPYDAPFTLPLRLHEAGVRFCIATGGGGFGSSNARNLPYHAAMAAAFGLPREEALRAVTRYPAEILGVGEHLGTIEPGKSASLLLADGDPLEIRTQVVGVYVDGRPVDVKDNRHYRLYERYRNRPRLARSP